MQTTTTLPSTPIDSLAADPSQAARSTCLLIKVDKLQLIVPRVLVAEVVDLEGVNFSSSVNKDIKMFEWRDYQVPLVSANLLSEECSIQIQRHSKIIVLHAVVNREKLPFYAFIASTNPRLVVVSTSSIEESGPGQSAGFSPVLMQVMVEGEMAAIPRVRQIEKFILESMAARS
ncbi:MAG: hypothetical protein V4628_17255 [Pseudomonadota bacterium]